tara:strand:- start:151 stop:486 length:336 start_codon:yes stop_codon:yes gene_type:complete
VFRELDENSLGEAKQGKAGEVPKGGKGMRDETGMEDTLHASPHMESNQLTLTLFPHRDSSQLFNLTSAECLNLINLKPTSDVEIHLLVEDCDKRMKDNEVEKLLSLAAELL